MLDAAMLPELDAPSRKRPSPESDNISTAQTSAPSSDSASESFVSATSGGSRSSTGTSSETEGSRKLSRLRISDDGSHVSCVGSSAGGIASSCVDGGGGSTDTIQNSSCAEKRARARVPALTKDAADGCIASRTRRSQSSCSGLTSRTALEARDAFTQQRNNTPSASSTRRTKPTTAPVAAKVAPVTARVQTATLAVMGRNTGLNLELPAISPELFEVIEVDSREEKQAAVHMHLSKNTCHEESQIVHERVFDGDHALCRTWVLIQPPTTSGARVRGASVTGVTYLAAVTLRLNVYRGRPGRWAQVLNMSTRRERPGLGTTLIAGMEELLRRELVDIIVLYIADNGRAPALWSTLGYERVAEGGSLLPPEDVLEVSKGGSLVPEFESHTMQLLPRWEKRIGSPAGAAGVVLELCNSEDGDVPDEETKRASSNAPEKQPKGALRSITPKDSRLCGSRLWACTNSLLELRKRTYNRAS